MPQLSIIVPVYNVEKYLARCIDSILSQPFIDYELLLIDDGSKDNSGRICDEYAIKDARIRVFHKENGGVSSARNLGLNNAVGEWVYFVDSDDELIEGCLDIICRNLDNNKDALLVGYVECDEDSTIIYSPKSKRINELSIDKAIAALYDSSFLNYKYLGYITIWVVKNSIIQANLIRFDESIAVKEDTLFVTEYLCCCQNKVGFVSEPVYKYYQRVDSVMGSLNETFNPKYLTSYDAVVKMFQIIQERYSDNSELMRLAKASVLNRVYNIKGYIKKRNVDDGIIKFLINSLYEVGLPYFLSYQYERYKRRAKNYIRRTFGNKVNG